MRLITASEFARLTGRGARTVQGWVEDKNGQPQEIDGVFRVGKAFAATHERWEEIAASKRASGRRDHQRRSPEKPPAETMGE